MKATINRKYVAFLFESKQIPNSSRATAKGKAAIHWIAGRLRRLPTAKSKILTRHLARPARATIQRIGAALPALALWAAAPVREGI